MKPIPVLPTIDPKALAQIAGSGVTRPITSIDDLPYDQTYLFWNKGRWEVYKRDEYPRLAGYATTILTAVFKARMKMPWYRR